jgi:hypothetical protein
MADMGKKQQWHTQPEHAIAFQRFMSLSVWNQLA